MPVTAQDLDTMARTIYGESRGETLLGQQAVAWVIINRARAGGWWGDTIGKVCRHPFQFSCWNADDPNRKNIEAVGVETPSFIRAIGVAALCLTDDLKDPTAGSTHYHNADVEPVWSKGKTSVAMIGHHHFFNDVA